MIKTSLGAGDLVALTFTVDIGAHPVFDISSIGSQRNYCALLFQRCGLALDGTKPMRYYDLYRTDSGRLLGVAQPMYLGNLPGSHKVDSMAS